MSSLLLFHVLVAHLANKIPPKRQFDRDKIKSQFIFGLSPDSDFGFYSR